MTTSLVISVLVLAVLFGAALLDLRQRQRLPRHHLDEVSKDPVRIGMGSVATMPACAFAVETNNNKDHKPEL